jgi:seryl-tRNA synthetase
MLQINFIRENAEVVKAGLAKKHFKNISAVDELLQLDGKGEVRRFTKAAKKVLDNASSYFPYLQSIVVLPSDTQSWTREIIEKRTEQICSLAYDRLSKWLEE